jgi:phosphohistidine phosphatase
MHQLLLLRHAKSSWDDRGIEDHERPLNPRGRAAAAAMRQAMRDVGLAPDLVLVSTARRTRETVEALEPWDDSPLIEPMAGLYLASAAQLMEAVREVRSTVRSLLVVGHNPGLHDFAMLLVGYAMDHAHSDMHRLATGLPTGGLVEFNIATPWSELRAGAGRLQRFLVPRDLPTVASA